MNLFLTTSVVATALAVAAAGPAVADEGSSSYCDYVEGVAAADSAVLMMPELFGSFGRFDQAIQVAVPDSSSNDLRLTAGVRFSLSGLYEGMQTRGRAKAECRRHRALDEVKGNTNQRALAARMSVLDKAMPQAEKLLAQANADLEGRRATAQDVNATRLRVDELRALQVATRRELGALPSGGASASSGALADYYAADAEVESHEGKLRRAKAIDLNVRVGYDKFLANDDVESPYFAVVQVGFNLGYLLQGGGNARAAAARRRMVQDEPSTGGSNATMSQMRTELETERDRERETGVLVDDLDKQLAGLRGIEGDVGRRLRQSLWFEAVKLRAQHAYHEARAESLASIVGGGASDAPSDE